MKNDTLLNRVIKRKEFSIIIMLVIVIALAAILSGGVFFKALNIRNILNAMVIVIFLTIGEGMLIIFGNVDLSAGAVGTLSACIMAHMLMTFNLPWWLSVIIAVLCGMTAGCINALLVTKLRFQPFIATLSMQFIAKGLSMVLTKGTAVDISSPQLSWIGTYRICNKIIPISVIISLALMLIYGIILARTKFGRSIYLCGGNKNATKLVGINSDKVNFILYLNMGALAALAGCMLAARVGTATVNGTNANQFSGVTAAILGGISFGGGSGGLLGAFFGLLLVNCFNNGMTLVGLDPYWQTVASGALLLLALIIDYYKSRSSRAI